MDERRTAELLADLGLPESGGAPLPERAKTMPANVSLRDQRAPRTTTPEAASRLGDILAELPRLDIGEAETHEIAILGELGRGGMGVVARGRQRSLGRDIAVKRLHSASPTAKRKTGLAQALVEEARVLGQLDHPAIVPVHALGTDAAGSPVLLMKRIDGVIWSEMLRDPEHAQWQRADRERQEWRPEDRLEWHLEVLVKVCHAVEYAHSRRLLHRDLKPDNVMVGDFGEVYVLDWGVSLSLEAVTDSVRALDARPALVGTPCYMAPEMLRRGAANERTDVFLLGGILHEVLTGRPPHTGDTLYAVLYAIAAGEARSFPPDTPPDLEAICNHALEFDLERRCESVRAFREAVSRALRHRASTRLCAQALARLDMSEKSGAQGPHLWECRFGLQQALEMWADNAAAEAGLRRCLEQMIERALAARDLDTASSLLAELRDADELEEKLRELRRAIDEERAHVSALESVAERHDVEMLQAERGRQLMWMAGSWAAFGVVLLTAGVFGFEPTYARLLIAALFPPAVVIGFGWWGRRLHSPVTRRLLHAFLVMTTTSFVVRLLGWRLQVPLHATLAFELVTDSLGGAVTAFLVDRRLLPPAALCASCAAVAIVLPEHSLELLVAGVSAGLAWAAMVWARRGPHTSVE